MSDAATEPSRFVILAGPRTGSTFLVDYLDGLPETRCCSELFQDARINFRHLEPADPRLADCAFRDAAPSAFLALAAAAAGCRRFGFKLIGSQLSKRDKLIREVCASPAWKKIYLWRHDLFEQAVSYALAARHFGGGIWERLPDEARLRLPPLELLDHLHTVQSIYFILEAVLAHAASNDVFALSYDELGSPEVMSELLRFLGFAEAEIARIDPPVFAPGPRLADRLENRDEIRRFFGKSRYRQLIEQSLAA